MLTLLRSLYHDSHLRCLTLLRNYHDQLRRSPIMQACWLSCAHYIILCNSMLKIRSSSIIVLIAYKIFTKIAKNLLTKRCTHCILNKSVARATKWNLSSAGRASALQAEGHRFEPYRFHSNFGWSYGEIAQLARACGSYPQCRGFESPSRY